jgi:ABC-type uncharacterized transport system involved in gliding motility auxiliary subunit
VSNKLLTTTGLLAGAAAFLALNLLADRTLRGVRADLTENGLYTVTEGSRNLVRGLQEPVTLRLYYSESLAADIPNIRSYAQRVRGLLEEYVAASDGQLTLAVLDPEPFSETEDAAVAAGIEGMPLNDLGDQLYFGLEASGSTDEREVIPFLDPRREESIEYDVSRILHKLGHTDRPVLAVVSALPLGGQEAAPWTGQPGSEPYFVYEELQDLYDVRLLQPGATELPEDTEILLVAHPKGASEHMLYAIDQFILRGGHALLFVDPFCDVDVPPPDPGNPMAQFGADRSSNLDRLFATWGLEVPADVFAGDRGSALTMPAGERRQPIAHIYYPQLQAESIDAKDVVTANVPNLVLGMPGILRAREDAAVQLTPLFRTSPDVAEVPTSAVQFMPDPQRLLAEFAPTGTPFTIGARVHGTVKTAFPEGRPSGAPPPAEGEEPAPPEGADPDFVAESREPINVIVVADADLLADRYWVSREQLFGQTLAVVRAGNGDFVLGALDNLSGSNDLISIRSRAATRRPFKVMEELRRDAEQRFAEREQELTAQLQETNRKLAELQVKKDGGTSLILSPEQSAEIERFQAERLATRKALRDVQYDLRKDIERLETWIKVVNIGLVPLLLGIVALALLGWRRQRRA